MSNLVLWGAGGHGKVVLDVARSAGTFQSVVFIDDDALRAGLEFCGCRVLGGAESLRQIAGYEFAIAIGDNLARARRYHLAEEAGLTAAVLIHRSATVSPDALIGAGTVVMPGSVVNPGSRIGRNCIINTGAVVEHDCAIGDHVHISPRVAMGGCVTVESYAHVGIGAVLLPAATVGESAVVGAGAVVLKDAPAGCTVVGVPAKTLARSSNK